MTEIDTRPTKKFTLLALTYTGWKKGQKTHSLHTLRSNYNNLDLVAWKSVQSSKASIGPQNMPLFVQVSHYSAQNPVHSILLCRPFKLIFLGVYSGER